ncbi:major facilitator superfamily domain-containing protein [Hygrophoropsis aurantiaca]|uniref:Major facilitator superfamily domain-containing protein n=1 Tax=Hygrophoropsis aurantiaca TaxID=72124 RepID=A0ACB8AMG0_9AGAM|nr:major facilitator superfamily domain-containing protein [Hygrophoropsis aurantiaca]
MGFFNWRSRSPPTKPWGLKWRSSIWFITTAVGFGITTDLLVYSIIIPVIPFQLEHLGRRGDVSSLTGWLLCAYSAGLVLSTIPIAMFSERHSARRTPLILGLFTLLASQVMLMEAPNYAVMAIARVIQGLSSSMVWIVGLALLCDTTPERHVGRQLGIAMTGLSVGLLVGSPAGGVLYSRYGFRAPFIFGEICTIADLVARILIIERGEALKWGYDPSALRAPEPKKTQEAPPSNHLEIIPIVASGSELRPSVDVDPEDVCPSVVIKPDEGSRVALRENFSVEDTTFIQKPLPLLAVIRKLAESPRALVALTMALVYGIVNSMQEPSLPLHLQAIWGFNSDQVGLVYLAAVVPALISSPLAGWYADRKGSDYLTCMCLFLALPWWGVMALRRSLPLFVVALATQSFFVSGVVAPVTAELAAVSRNIEGVGYAHVYGAFNLAFGIGTAVGPVVGGQIYDRATHGWTAVCCITAALIVICILLAFCYTGADPLLAKVLRQYHLPVPEMMHKVPKADSDSEAERETHTTSRIA